MSNTAASTSKGPGKARVSDLDRPATYRMLNEQKAEILGQLEGLQKEFDEAAKITKKHPGISKEVTRLHARWKALYERVNELDPEAIAKNPYRVKLAEGELEAIRQSMAAFESFSDMLSKLRTKANKLEENQTVIVDQHNGLVGAHNKVAYRVADVETEVQAYRLPRGLMWFTIIAAIIVGFIVGLAWHNTTFTDTMKLSGGTSVTFKNQLNEPFYPWIVGILAAAAVILVMLLVAMAIMLVKRIRSRNNSTPPHLVKTYTLDDDEEIVPATSSTEDLAPTKPIMAEGATSGAR